MPPNHSVMLSLLDQRVSDSNDEQMAFIAPRLVPLRKMTLFWEYVGSEPFEVWGFAEFNERPSTVFGGITPHQELAMVAQGLLLVSANNRRINLPIRHS